MTDKTYYLCYRMGCGSYVGLTATSLTAAKSACARDLGDNLGLTDCVIYLTDGKHSYIELARIYKLAKLYGGKSNGWVLSPAGKGYECWRRKRIPHASPVYFKERLAFGDAPLSVARSRWRYKWFGQPQPGWYISGSVPELWQAKNALTSFFHIVELAS